MSLQTRIDHQVAGCMPTYTLEILPLDDFSPAL